MLRKKMLIILLAMLTFKTFQFKACGLIELFDGVQKLNQSNYIHILEDLKLGSNGSQLSVFGWFRLTEISQAQYQIINIQTYDRQVNQNNKSNLSDLFYLTYNAANPRATYFEIAYAKHENQLEIMNDDVHINQNQWVFIAYTVDYERESLKLYYNTYTNSSVIERSLVLQVNQPSFFIRQNLQVDIGCFSFNQISRFQQAQCVTGEAKDFNFMLQYFETPQHLLYMNYHNNHILQYTFDLKPNQPEVQQVLPINGYKVPLIVDGEKKFLDGSFVIKGDTQMQIFNAFQLRESSEVQSPSIYMTFEYEEPLLDEFLLFELVPSHQLGFKIQVYLSKNRKQEERQVKIKIPELKFEFMSRNIYKEKQVQNLNISFVQEMNQFQVIANKDFSRKEVIKGIQDFNLQLFEKNQPIQGFFKVIQLSLLESASGFFFRQLNQNQKLECRQSCLEFSNLNYDSMQCLQCNEYKVLEPVTSQCVDYCQMGTKNQGGICINCQDNECSETKQKKFFQIIKLSKDEYEIKILENFNKNQFLTNNFFDVQISGLTRQKDFKYKTMIISNDPSGNTILVQLELAEQFQNENFEITFMLRKELNLYSMQKNELPIQVVVFDRLSTNQNPKEDRIEVQQVPRTNLAYQDYLKPQLQYTEAENKISVSQQQNLDLVIQQMNQNPELASSTSTQNKNFVNKTLDMLLNQNNAKYPQNQSNNQVTEHQQEQITHKDSHKSLTSNDTINKDASEFLFAIFVVALCFGLFGQFFKYKDDDFLFQKYVQMILVYQYISFMALYDVYLPETLSSFLGPLLSDLLMVQKIFDAPIREKHSQNHNFNLDYQTFTNKKFQENEISQHFIINSGLIFVIHATILAILIIVSILYKCMKKRNNTLEPNMFISALRSIKRVITNKLLSTMFLVLLIEITIFSLYNFEHNGFHHPTFQFSLFLAFIYFLLTIFCLMHISCHSNQRRQNSSNDIVYYPQGYGFIYQGLTQKGCGKYFQALQYLHYFIYSLVVIMAHKEPKVQVVFHFLILLIFSIYVFSKQPAKHEFWQFEQTFHQILLLIVLFFLMIVILDFGANRISMLGKDIIGDFVSYLMTVVLTWNAFIVIICSLRNFYYKTCNKKKSTYDSVGSLPKSVEMKKEKPKQEKLKNSTIIEQSNEDDSQLMGNDEENNKEKLNYTALQNQFYKLLIQYLKVYFGYILILKIMQKKYMDPFQQDPMQHQQLLPSDKKNIELLQKEYMKMLQQRQNQPSNSQNQSFSKYSVQANDYGINSNIQNYQKNNYSNQNQLQRELSSTKQSHNQKLSLNERLLNDFEDFEKFYEKYDDSFVNVDSRQVESKDRSFVRDNQNSNLYPEFLKNKSSYAHSRNQSFDNQNQSFQFNSQFQNNINLDSLQNQVRQELNNVNISLNQSINKNQNMFQKIKNDIELENFSQFVPFEIEEVTENQSYVQPKNQYIQQDHIENDNHQVNTKQQNQVYQQKINANQQFFDNQIDDEDYEEDYNQIQQQKISKNKDQQIQQIYKEDDSDDKQEINSKYDKSNQSQQEEDKNFEDYEENENEEIKINELENDIYENNSQEVKYENDEAEENDNSQISIPVKKRNTEHYNEHDETPIAGGGNKKTFEQLLEEQLKKEQKESQNQTPIKPKKKKEFLRKNTGLQSTNVRQKKPELFDNQKKKKKNNKNSTKNLSNKDSKVSTQKLNESNNQTQKLPKKLSQTWQKQNQSDNDSEEKDKDDDKLENNVLNDSQQLQNLQKNEQQENFVNKNLSLQQKEKLDFLKNQFMGQLSHSNLLLEQSMQEFQNIEQQNNQEHNRDFQKYQQHENKDESDEEFNEEQEQFLRKLQQNYLQNNTDNEKSVSEKQDSLEENEVQEKIQQNQNQYNKQIKDDYKNIEFNDDEEWVQEDNKVKDSKQEQSKNILQKEDQSKYIQQIKQEIEKKFNEKIVELEKEMKNFQIKNQQLNIEKQRVEELRTKLERKEEKFDQEKEELIESMQKQQDEEIKKIKKEKQIALRNIRAMANKPNKKEREEIEKLKEELAEIRSQKKLKEKKLKSVIERQRKDNFALQDQIENLKKQIQYLEKQRIGQDEGNDNTQEEKSNQRKRNKSLLQKKIQKEKNKFKQLQQKKNQQKEDEEEQDDEIDGKSICSGASNNSFILQNIKKVEKPKKMKIKIYTDLLETFNHIKEKENKKKLHINQENYKWDNNKYYKSFLKEEGKNRKIKHQEVNEGFIHNFYEDELEEIIFPNKSKKKIFPNGYSIVKFLNGDLKQKLPDGTIIYYYNELKITQITLNNEDKTNIYRFENKQVEFHYENGKRKEISFPDGTEKFIYANNEIFTFFEDKTVQSVNSEGVKLIEFIDGTFDIIYPDGKKLSMDIEGNITEEYEKDN